MMNRIEVWDKNRLEAQEMQDDDEVLEEAMDELDISKAVILGFSDGENR